MTSPPAGRDGGAGALSPMVLSALRRIIRAVDLHSRALVQQCGLTGPQLVVLKELLERDGCSAGELARAVALSQPTVTGILDRLERKGMVTRRRSADDRRRVMVSTTAEARRALAGAPPLLQNHFTAAFERLPDWEQHQILSALQRIVLLMEAGGVEAGPILTTGPLDASSEGTAAFLGDSAAPSRRKPHEEPG